LTWGRGPRTSQNEARHLRRTHGGPVVRGYVPRSRRFHRALSTPARLPRRPSA
jgi:hypothetical protein